MDMITLAMAKAYSDSKGGYTEKKTKKVEVFPNTTLEFADSYGNGYGYVEGLQPISLTDGKEYTVTFDGVEYRCIAEVNTIAGTAQLGNICLRDLIDGGVEPFFYDYFEGLHCHIISRTAGTHTIEIYYIEEEETIHPIDPKYLPSEAVPKIIDLTKFRCSIGAGSGPINGVLLAMLMESAQTGGTAVRQSQSDIDNLKEAVGTNPNILLQVNVNGAVVSLPVMHATMEGGIAEAAQLSCAFVMEYGGMYLDTRFNIQFVLDSTQVHFFVQATPITV